MSFLEFQNQVNKTKAASEANRAMLKTARQKAANIKRSKEQLIREIGAADRETDERLTEIINSEIEFAREVDAGKKAYLDALSHEWVQLNEFSQFTDPMENIGSFTDDCPILLFPLRLETRFKKVKQPDGEVDQLWVRVFPDEIAINSFESDLSDTEIRNSRSYWLARWKLGKDVDGNRGAWRSLAATHGPGRAYWLTNNYVPVNRVYEPEMAEGEIILAIGTDNALVDPELSAISTYWQAVWKANKQPAPLTRAWDELLTVVSEDRATTLFKDYKPVNISDLPPAGLTHDEMVVRVEFVIFPKTDELETKLHAWSQPPTTSILPERFVFLAYQDGVQAMSPQLGNLIPPKLILGPDPAAEEGEDFRLAGQDEAVADPNINEGDLIFSENMRWMFDFDEAVAKGMGFRINLTPGQAVSGFDRVFVLGLKLGADEKTGQALLEGLFQDHQNSRKGMSIIRQGTPTNNTEEEQSGYSWQHDPDDSFDIYFDKSYSKYDSKDYHLKTDGRWLAELLGIKPESLYSVENYYNTDIAEAKAMQLALWPATMGHFMDSMMNPVFSKNVIEQTREFFTRHVSGRGNLPAIRVGKQPYGILPATNYTNMRWFEQPSHVVAGSGAASVFRGQNSFLSGLYKVLMDMDKTWMDLTKQVSYVGKQGDPHQILLDIIGLHPDSVEVYNRYANSIKQVHNIYSLIGFLHPDLFSYYPKSYAAAATLLAKYGYVINKRNQEPDIFKKSFFENAWVLKGDRVDKVPNTESDPISIYTTDNKNYIQWLIEAAEDSHDRLRLQTGFVEDRPPTALLYLLLYHSLDLSYIDTSLKLHQSKGVLTESQVQRAYIEPDFIHIEEKNETESRWKYLYKSDERITGDPDILLGKYISQNIYNLNEAAAFSDVIDRLRQLEDVPTARLERTLMEHIDTVSCRYDAWVLGFLDLQLEYMRNLSNDDEEDGYYSPNLGVYLGAYGWLEDLRPENKVLTPVKLPEELNEVFNPKGDLVEDANNAGYILAPSQNHAVTAAILRNGHLSNDEPEDKEELSIKLTSQRVRLALRLIEGIQGGQSLSALLGYQFERGLHDRTDAEVDEFIFELRDAFPLAARKFKETTPGVDDLEYESIDQIEAKNVMDGVALLEHIEETGVQTYPFKLNSAPFNRTMPTGSEGQENAINEVVLELIETNDALADLALAESVHQVVQGNYERAAATLDTYSKGNFPPTPDVIKTPRSGTNLTHRVALQFRTGLSHSLSDSGVTPRMVAEPAIHDWLNQIMPGMDEIVCVVSYVDRDTNSETEHEVSLSEIGLSHIDALYLLNIDSEQAMSALDDLITQFVVSKPEYSPRMDQSINIEYTRKLVVEKSTIFEMTSLISSLRALLLKSKPLNATDVKLSNEAARENEQTVTLDQDRVAPIITALSDFRTNTLAVDIAALTALILADDVDGIVTELDNLIRGISTRFIHASAYGMPQSGIGFVYQWQQTMHTQLRTKLDELIARWDRHLNEYTLLREEYTARQSDVPINEELLFLLLTKAELKISSTITVPIPPTLVAYETEIADKLSQFEDMLNNEIRPRRDTRSLTDLIKGIQTIAGGISAFDIIGIDITDQLKQVEIFAEDLKIGAENLSQEINNRVTRAGELLSSVASTSDPLVKAELVKNAAKVIFGDDFVIVPEFTLDSTHGTEWQNALTDSEHSLRYLLTDLDKDFPMDDWLYGISRVRENLSHVETTLIHMEGFTGTSLNLVPSQFPYRENDYWLGMEFPDKKPGTDDPFTIDEDKLLFTSIYTEAFNPGQPQCGLLLDEWTEVIPSRDETAGLSFHYDQPNSEPPQTLLLALPSDFTGNWQWDDLVNTLHETLDMAKKRAVEPDHVDTTVYSRFLPSIVSLASPLPLTSTLNLVRNNQVFFRKVFSDG